MRIIWTDNAIQTLDSNLLFWYNKTKSNDYPNKIIKEIEKVEEQIKENPFFLSFYIKDLNLFQKIFFKGKFLHFYGIYEAEDFIIIHHFRSNKQKPLV